ncbi:MAG: hypothetical protein ACOCQR_02580 [bacterium]
MTTKLGISMPSSSPPVIDEENIYYQVSFDNNKSYLYCVDKKNGSIIWKSDEYNYINAGSPLLSNGYLYVIQVDDDILYLRAVKTGTDQYEMVWEYELYNGESGQHGLSSPMIYKDKLYHLTPSGLYIFD